MVREVPRIASLSRDALLDHLPEFLDALASWVEGEVDQAREGFRLLAEGHALQRQSIGVELEALTDEYMTLRRITFEEVAAGIGAAATDDAIARLNSGLDEAIRQAVVRYARARDSVRERFVGILAHDLREPLAAVAMATTMLQDTPLDAQQRKLVERAVRSAGRMEHLITDVLDFTRGNLAGGIPITPVGADMAMICRSAADEISAAHKTPIQVEVTGDLRGHWDPERVKQALGNLLSNALQHGTGPFTLRAWERDDRKLLFTSVNNRGPVIAADVMSRLFDPFAEGSDERRGRRGGLGLGLYIVQQIALAHGGRCRVTSNAETGTTFTIEWPRITPVVEQERPAPS